MEGCEVTYALLDLGYCGLFTGVLEHTYSMTARVVDFDPKAFNTGVFFVPNGNK